MENAEILKTLAEAALPHVVFDGWSQTTLQAAIADSGIAPGVARALLPRGGLDLARAWHRQGDLALAARLAEEDLAALRFRDRIAHAIRLRLALSDREALRRASALHALHPADGAACLWETAETIWTALGDTSRDLNWYTKRATLAAVHGAAVLYWLGEPEDLEAFIDRRIEGVMAFEKTKAKIKAKINAGPLGRLLAGPLRLADKIVAPSPPTDLPGSLRKGV